MTYRLDDEGAFDAAVLAAGNEAYGACVRAGQESARQGTDGIISGAMALAIASAEVWEMAIEAMLVARLDKGAIELCPQLFRNWNPTAEKAKLLKAKRAEVGKLGGLLAAKRKAIAQPIAVANDLPKAEPIALPVAKQRGLGSGGSGSGSDPEGDARGSPLFNPPSETRIRTPVPPPPEPSAEQVAIALQIRSHPMFRSLDAHRLAATHVGRMLTNPQKLEWVIEAIDDLAAKADGVGLTHEALQAKLVGWMRNAKGPRMQAPKVQPSEPLGQEIWRTRQKAGGT